MVYLRDAFDRSSNPVPCGLSLTLTLHSCCKIQQLPEPPPGRGRLGVARFLCTSGKRKCVYNLKNSQVMEKCMSEGQDLVQHGSYASA